MKKLTLAIFFTLLLSFYFLSCGDDDDDSDDKDGGDGDTIIDDDYGDGGGGDDDTTGRETWADSTSGLMWQANPMDWDDSMNWIMAKNYCQNLILGGYEDWRLPSISELRSLIRGCEYTEVGGSCNVTDACRSSDCWNQNCNSCSGSGPTEGCFWPWRMNGTCSWYWSSTTQSESSSEAWTVYFDFAGIGTFGVEVGAGNTRCVRTGGDSDDDDTIGDDGHVPGNTWTDPATGLTWQVHQLDEYVTWEGATSYCHNLDLAGGGWHLPTISEWRTLIRGCPGTKTGGTCGVSDSCLDSSCLDASCHACKGYEGPNKGCYGLWALPDPCDGFWSSSLVADSEGSAWAVYLGQGEINDGYILDANRDVRCVR